MLARRQNKINYSDKSSTTYISLTFQIFFVKLKLLKKSGDFLLLGVTVTSSHWYYDL